MPAASSDALTRQYVDARFDRLEDMVERRIRRIDDKLAVVSAARNDVHRPVSELAQETSPWAPVVRRFQRRQAILTGILMLWVCIALASVVLWTIRLS